MADRKEKKEHEAELRAELEKARAEVRGAGTPLRDADDELVWPPPATYTDAAGTHPIRMDRSNKIVLFEPVKVGRSEINELELRPMRGKDINELPAKGIRMGDQNRIVASLAGVAPSVVGELSMLDLRACYDVVNAFLQVFQPTGEQESSS